MPEIDITADLVDRDLPFLMNAWSPNEYLVCYPVFGRKKILFGNGDFNKSQTGLRHMEVRITLAQVA